MLNTSLNPSQKVCLRFIEAYSTEHGYAPTIREIQAHLDYKSPSSAANILDVLRAAGYVSSEPNIARSIRVLRQDQAA